jgi:hypothetical protein
MKKNTSRHSFAGISCSKTPNAQTGREVKIMLKRVKNQSL